MLNIPAGKKSFEHLLRHLLLLFLPLGRLQVEEGVDFLFLRLSIGQLQYIVIDRLRSPGGGSTDRRFSPRCITSVDWHLAGDIASCAAFSRTSGRQPTGYDRSGARDDSGVIVICYRWSDEKLQMELDLWPYPLLCPRYR